MEKEWIEEEVAKLNFTEILDLSEIPNIDLYMDQLITLFEDKFKDTKRYEEDKLLTKTMINNYTKDKVLMPAVKKKYTKEHIVLMALLYKLKNILSIGDIKDVFSVLKDKDHVDSEKLTALYKGYLSSREKEIGYFNQGITHRVDTVSEEMKKLEIEDEDVESVLLVLILIEQASYHKKLAERIIDRKLKKLKV